GPCLSRGPRVKCFRVPHPPVPRDTQHLPWSRRTRIAGFSGVLLPAPTILAHPFAPRASDVPAASQYHGARTRAHRLGDHHPGFLRLVPRFTKHQPRPSTGFAESGGSRIPRFREYIVLFGPAAVLDSVSPGSRLGE
ncbi:hypothetical protein FB45DRAFT_1067677, partial [Roridomyces roridus]